MVPRRGRSPRSSALRAASWSQPSPQFPLARATFASGNFGVRDRNHGGRGSLTREPPFEAYAAWLGIDIDKDADLLWIARAGITAPLPMPWKPCQAADDGDVFYFNFDTGLPSLDEPTPCPGLADGHAIGGDARPAERVRGFDW
mmetsp:Transcript_58486/g.167865  ORF Transcript_58486/g.167865 Transcript_58486/m.167865 type:complete len:144 (+) Transcript_58486:80-511(+)